MVMGSYTSQRSPKTFSEPKGDPGYSGCANIPISGVTNRTDNSSNQIKKRVKIVLQFWIHNFSNNDHYKLYHDKRKDKEIITLGDFAYCYCRYSTKKWLVPL